jgi:hypothetical protein
VAAASAWSPPRTGEVGEGVRIEVSDTGIGIPPDHLPRVFEKFFQVENQAQPRSVGSGLGLAIAREIVEAHGGTISAESEVGKGRRSTWCSPYGRRTRWPDTFSGHVSLMKRLLAVLMLAAVPACAHLPLTATGERTRLWDEAHHAFQAGSSRTRRSSSGARRTPSGHRRGPGESLLRGNGPARPAQSRVGPAPRGGVARRYLGHETEQPGATKRRPEAETLLQLAQQLNMPPAERVPGLQPEVVTREVPRTQRVVVPAQESRELAAEVERLRAQVAERDATIRQQREELERIRRTLTRPTQ